MSINRQTLQLKQLLEISHSVGHYVGLKHIYNDHLYSIKKIPPDLDSEKYSMLKLVCALIDYAFNEKRI